MSLDALDPEHLFITGVVTGDLAGYLSGRTEIIEEAANRLAASNMSCFLHGDRGVGKSTVAWQVAALLEGKNRVFSKESSLSFGREKNFVPCIARVSEDCNSVGDLLLDAVTVDVAPESFVNRYRDVLSSERFISEINSKFGLSIKDIFSGEIGTKWNQRNPLDDAQRDERIQGSEKTKQQIFDTFLAKALATETRPDTRIIFFIDEMDRRPKLPKLGAKIKDSNNVQFCFVGIADTVDEIIEDHESAGRKLSGGALRVDSLSDDEISWIFDNAEQLSGGLISFDAGFRKLVLEYADGMPWIAQHVGFEACFKALPEARRGGAERLIIGDADFKPAMRRAIEHYRDVFNRRHDLEATVQDSRPADLQVLKILLRSRLPLTEEEIKAAIPPRRASLKRWVSNALERLLRSQVIRKDDGRYRYSTALLRIFVRYIIAELTVPTENNEGKQTGAS